MTPSSVHEQVQGSSLRGFEEINVSAHKAQKTAAKAKKAAAFKKALKARDADSFHERLLRALKKHFAPKKAK